MKRLIFAIAAALSGNSALATAQCPTGADCAPLPDQFHISIVAAVVAAGNVCARLDPAKAEQYSQAVDKLMAEDRAAYLQAMGSTLFPSALQAMEAEMAAKPAEKLRRGR